MANEPFSENICRLVLEKLQSQQFVNSLVDDLRTKFSVSLCQREREREIDDVAVVNSILYTCSLSFQLCDRYIFEQVMHVLSLFA